MRSHRQHKHQRGSWRRRDDFLSTAAYAASEDHSWSIVSMASCDASCTMPRGRLALGCTAKGVALNLCEEPHCSSEWARDGPAWTTEIISRVNNICINEGDVDGQ